MQTKKNLLIFGASGNIGHTVLVYLKNHRHLFEKVVLVDKRDFTGNTFIQLAEVDVTFVKLEVKEETRGAFSEILQNHQIDIVLDVSDASTELISDIVFTYGNASYICCAFCTENEIPFGEALDQWITAQRQKEFAKPHILFTGMNPGCVNIWAGIGIERHGTPSDITEFEYDTSRFLRHHREKMVTWCVHEFIEELVTDEAELTLGAHQIKNMHPNGLFHQQDMKELFSPILKLSHYPQGCILMHEECLTLSNKYNVPCRFVYTVNRETMQHIRRIYEEKGKVTEEDLVLGDNIRDPLIGSDNIAMRLTYPDRMVYYFNTISCKNLKETSATDLQVTIGIYAALFALLEDSLKGGIFFPEDLLKTPFSKFLTDNMMIREYVFTKGGDGILNLASYDPHISYGTGPFTKI